MKANSTGSKVTAMKVPTANVKSAKKINTPAKLVVAVGLAKAVRRSGTRVDVELPITAPVPSPSPVPVKPVGTSKQARLISMLNASSGATLEQMMNLTGWQAHTVRGAISGVLRKRLGLNVVCDAAGSEARRYRIVNSVSA